MPDGYKLIEEHEASEADKARGIIKRRIYQREPKPMPESPDFDQIARSIVDQVESHVREPFIPGADDPVRETVIRQIAEQLRQVWNARGQADMEQLRAIREDTGTGDTGEILTPRFLAEVISRSDR